MWPPILPWYRFSPAEVLCGISRREAEACVGHSTSESGLQREIRETAAAGGLKAGIRVRQRGVRGRAQGGKGTKEENRRGLRAGSGEGPQSEELLQRDDSAPGGKEWEGENSEPNCKSIR